jgi:pSer/pThr/pTyr-binding forkhead associated (FHA) protein
MRDGLTRRLEPNESKDSFSEFLARWRATIVVLSGADAGTEHDLQRPHVTLGRGPETDLCFDDPAMSREHAALEFTGSGFRIRDLGSMNGLLLNGGETRVGDLKNGDRFQLGEHVFQYLLEQSTHKPRAYVLPDD